MRALLIGLSLLAASANATVVSTLTYQSHVCSTLEDWEYFADWNAYYNYAPAADILLWVGPEGHVHIATEGYEDIAGWPHFNTIRGYENNAFFPAYFTCCPRGCPYTHTLTVQP